MGITISNAVSMPAIVYDKIHMTRMEITQPVFTADGQNPVYEMKICYRHYGVVDGVRYYANEDIQVISIPDFLAEAIADATAGDNTLLTALASLEQAVAAIIADQTGATATVI